MFASSNILVSLPKSNNHMHSWTVLYPLINDEQLIKVARHQTSHNDKCYLVSDKCSITNIKHQHYLTVSSNIRKHHQRQTSSSLPPNIILTNLSPATTCSTQGRTQPPSPPMYHRLTSAKASCLSPRCRQHKEPGRCCQRSGWWTSV